MISISKWIAAFSSGSILVLSATATEIVESETIYVVDGDTFYMRKNDGSIPVRLAGIDAPEIRQVCIDASGKSLACGLIAKKRLAELVQGSTVHCVFISRDLYGRFLGTCYIGNEDIAQTLVHKGWARAYYSQKYVPQELYAKRTRQGFWSGVFGSPAQYRRAHQ